MVKLKNSQRQWRCFHCAKTYKSQSNLRRHQKLSCKSMESKSRLVEKEKIDSTSTRTKRKKTKNKYKASFEMINFQQKYKQTFSLSGLRYLHNRRTRDSEETIKEFEKVIVCGQCGHDNLYSGCIPTSSDDYDI